VFGGTSAQRARTRKHDVATPDRWYVFVSPDGDFKLSFPQKPIREPDGQGPRTPIRNYGLNTENGMRFSINFQGMAAGPNWSLANEWNDDYERDLLERDREEKRRVVQTRRIGKHTFEAEIWDAGTDNGESLNYIRRTIVRQTRVYTLLCGSRLYGRKVNKSICRRFFNSMNFLPNNSSARQNP
jgi:hypothetical protein